MVEEQVFKKDTPRASTRWLGNFGVEVNAGLFKAKGGLRGELMRRTITRRKRARREEGRPQRSDGKIGDDSFDKDGARTPQGDRRSYVGAFRSRPRPSSTPRSRRSSFGLKVKITRGDLTVRPPGGLKVSTGDPAQAGTRLAMGIAGASQNGIKTIVGVVRNIVDKDHPVAGSSATSPTASPCDDIGQQHHEQRRRQRRRSAHASRDAPAGLGEPRGGDPLAKLSGQDAPVSESSKAAVNSESMYRFGISLGSNSSSSRSTKCSG